MDFYFQSPVVWFLVAEEDFLSNMSSQQNHVEDKRDLLKQPLHGIYIPSALVVIGTLIIDWRYLPYSGGILVAFLAFRLISAYQRRSSIHSEKWNSLELLDKTVISKNSAIYRFKLNRETETLDVPVGHHLSVQVDDAIRYYTPISSKFETGAFDLLVKSYPDGNVSKHFASLTPGKTVKFRGPVGRFNYATNHVKEIGIVAGGSGITPILQVLSEIITTPEDLTRVSLIYANETENDILLKEELDTFNEKYPYFDVHYVLNKPKDDWKGEVGYVTKDLVERYLPKPSDDSRILVCGPPGLKTLVTDITEELGFKRAVQPSKGDDQVFIF